MKTPVRHKVLWITLIYISVAGVWSGFSKVVLAHFARNLNEGVRLGMVADGGFSLIMGGFLYAVMRRSEKERPQRSGAENDSRRTQRALQTISACNGVLVRATSEAMLLTDICRLIIEKGGHRMAWVGFAQNDEQKSVGIAAFAGHDEGYLQESNITWAADHERGRGPTGTAIRTGEIVVCNDFQTDPLAIPWRAAAVRHGFGSNIVLPLRHGEKTLGVLVIYAAETQAFNAMEVTLLKELADDLAYGMQALRTQAEHLKAEQSRHVAEENYRQVFECARDAIFTLDPSTGRFISSNPAARKMFGVATEAEFLAHGPEDFSPEQQPDGSFSADLARATDERLMQEGPQFFEWKHRRLGGEEFMADVLLTRMERDGKPLVLATVRDVTRRRRTEDTLRASERKFEKLFYGSPLPMSLSAIADGLYLDANEEFLRMLQRSREEVIGHTSRDLNVWGDPIQRAALVAKFNHHGSMRNVDLQIRNRSGELRQILWSAEELMIGREKCWLASWLDITERKRAEESLRTSEAFVRNVLDSLTAHIAVLDEAGKIVAVNQAWRRFASENGGREDQVFLGAGYLEACQGPGGPPANREALSAADGVRAVLAGTRTSFHLEYPCHSATAHGWFLMHVWPLETGRGVVVSHENITERKQTELLLGFVAQEGWSRPQENYLVRLVEYIGLTLGVDYVFIGRRGEDEKVRTTGLYAQGRIVPDIEYSTRGAPCHNVIGKVLCHYGDHLQEMFPASPLRAEMGAQSYLGIPLTDSTGQPLGLMALLDAKPMPDAQLATAVLQIAAVRVAGEMERLAKVEELHWKTALLEAQMEAAPDGILMIDNQGRRILQNQRMNDLLKIPPHISAPEDDSAQVAFVASRAKDPRKLTDKIAHLYAHPEEISRDEVEFVDGTIVERYSSPVRAKSGRSAGRIWTFRDITQARQLEAQLRQSQKMEAIGQLAGGVAHDFNNILTSLIMQAEFIGMAPSLPARVTQGLQQIRADGERAAKLTRQLLLFSRRQTMQSSQLDLNDIVTNLAKMLQRIIGEDVHLQLNLHPIPLMTRADAGMVEQVLMNLVVNARDAMPGGGRVSIETTDEWVTEEAAALYPDARPGHYVCFSVRDTGTGIPPEILPQIFDPFFTTKEAGKGTGLGLATVFGIVKQHEGWLKVDNHPGHGVTFRIFLPACTTMEAAAPKPEAKPALNGGSETILLVEDEEGVRQNIQCLLLWHGYRVLIATNGPEAFEQWLVHGKNVALLLTDLVMPGGMSGYQLARNLQTNQPALKILYMSGYSAEIAGRQMELHSGEAFIQKPFLSDALLETVRRSLDG